MSEASELGSAQAWGGPRAHAAVLRAVHAVKNTFLQTVSAKLVKVTAGPEEQASPRKILVLF